MPSPRPRNEFDAVCVGTSPLVIMEALHQDRMGKKTLLVDAADRLGGAWSEFQVFGLKRVEIAPHFLRFDDAAYAYLRDDLGVPLPPMAPQPKYMVTTPFRRFWISYSAAPWITFMAVPIYCLRHPRSLANLTSLNASFHRIHDAVRLLFRRYFSGLESIVRYPPGGTLQLMDQLTSALKVSGVEVRLGQRLDSIKRESNGNLACDLGGRQITTKRIFATEHQRICATLADEGDLRSHFKEAEYLSLHLLIKTSQPTRTAFVQTKRERTFNLLSDLTSYTPDVPAGHRLLVLRLICNKLPHDRARADEMLQILTNSNYLAPDSKLIDFQFSTYRQGTASAACLRAISDKYGPAVTVFQTSCLTTSLGRQIARWNDEDSCATIPFRGAGTAEHGPVGATPDQWGSPSPHLPASRCMEEKDRIRFPEIKAA